MSVLLIHSFKSIHQIIGTGSGGAEVAAAPHVFFYGQLFNCWEYKKSISLYTVYLYWNIWDLTMKRDLIRFELFNSLNQIKMCITNQ